MHDFWDRPQYHVVSRYVEARHRVGSLVLFDKRPDADRAAARRLLARYQYLPADRSRETMAAWVRWKLGLPPFRLPATGPVAPPIR
jgi:hypothetical protein